MKKIEVDCGYRIEDDNGNIIRYNGGSTWQGWVYKDHDAFESGKGVCYIPEYDLQDYEKELKGLTEEEIVDYHKGENSFFYTRQNFLDMCDCNEDLAREVFYAVDWQSPETYLNELEESDWFFDTWALKTNN